MASSAKEKITRHYQAEVQHSAQLAQETSVKTAALKSDIDKTVAALSAIKIEDLDQFHGLEAELDAARPNVTTILRQGDPETAASHIQTLLTTIDAKACAAVLAKLNAKDSKPTVSSLREKLTAWICADEIAKIVGLAEPLSVFSELSRDAQAPLIDFITQYENLRRPIIGWLFQGKKLRELNARVGLVLPCPDTLDLHKRLSDLKASAKALATISQWLEKKEQSGQEAFVYRLIRDKRHQQKASANSMRRSPRSFVLPEIQKFQRWPSSHPNSLHPKRPSIFSSNAAAFCSCGGASPSKCKRCQTSIMLAKSHRSKKCTPRA